MTTAAATIDVDPQSTGCRRRHLAARSVRLGSGQCFIGRSSRNRRRSSASSPAEAWRRSGSGSRHWATSASRLGGTSGRARPERGRRRTPPFHDHPPQSLQRRRTGRRRVESRLAGDHLEEDQPQRVQVRPLVDRLDRRAPLGVEGVEVLGGHVRQRPSELRLVELVLLQSGRVAVGLDVHGQVEVEQHRGAVGRDQDVGRLKVAVQKASRMSVIEPFGQARDDPDRGPNRIGAAKEPAAGKLVVEIILGGRFRAPSPSSAARSSAEMAGTSATAG